MKKAIFSFVLPLVLTAVVTIFAYNMYSILHTNSGTDRAYANPSAPGKPAKGASMGISQDQEVYPDATDYQVKVRTHEMEGNPRLGQIRFLDE